MDICGAVYDNYRNYGHYTKRHQREEMNHLKLTNNNDQVNNELLAKVVDHIDYILTQFRMRIVHSKVNNPLKEFTKQGLSDLREIDHNHWLRVMNAYFLRLKSYFMEGVFFVGAVKLNELISIYTKQLMNIKNASMDDYEHIIIHLFGLFSKNTRK